MKVLVTGGSGILGQYLNIELSKNFEMLTTYNNNVGNCEDFYSKELDITNTERLEEIFADFQPECVLHLAAISRPADCEVAGRERVMEVNVEATKNIARLCHKFGAKLIFTSTELVYDGEQGFYLAEHSKLNPVSLYAESKLMAEQKIKETFDNYIILRTSLLFGIVFSTGQSSFDRMYRDLRINKSVELFFNQYRTPLSTLDASRLLVELLKKDIATETVNFGGPERVSRLELGKVLCEVANLDKELLVRTSMYNSETANAVRDVSFNTERFQRFGIKQKGLNTAMRELITFAENITLM
ncbi:MAG: NAD(P)-dependent oxidoreductase [Rhodothermaceae bacterium]